MNPPPDEIQASIVHKIRGLYLIIYVSGKKLGKADKLGIRSKTEQACLHCLRLSIEAALAGKYQKLSAVEKVRIETEMVKQLVRLESDMGIIPEKAYISWQEKLREISMMATGWIKFLQAKGPV